MNVGDLVTLSAAGQKIDRIIDEHKRYFRGAESSYYRLHGDDQKRFVEYWDNNKMVGLITKLRRNPIERYDYERSQYVRDGEKVTYYVAWQANPKPMACESHTRGHLKFVKRGKKK